MRYETAMCALDYCKMELLYFLSLKVFLPELSVTNEDKRVYEDI